LNSEKYAIHTSEIKELEKLNKLANIMRFAANISVELVVIKGV
jgi:hypothetical protein